MGRSGWGFAHFGNPERSGAVPGPFLKIGVVMKMVYINQISDNIRIYHFQIFLGYGHGVRGCVLRYI